MDKMSASHLDLYYGDNHALKDVSLPIAERKVTAFIEMCIRDRNRCMRWIR